MSAESDADTTKAAVEYLRILADGLVGGEYFLKTMSGRSEIITLKEAPFAIRRGPRYRIEIEFLDNDYESAAEDEVSDWEE